jgi:transposase
MAFLRSENNWVTSTGVAGKQLHCSAVARYVCHPRHVNGYRFAQHGKAYFEFVTKPGVEPTNNLAEQAIRFVVIDRRVTQGTRGEKGRRWCERIWTVIATCSQQGRSVFEYLSAAVAALFNGRAAPSLLATES